MQKDKYYHRIEMWNADYTEVVSIRYQVYISKEMSGSTYCGFISEEEFNELNIPKEKMICKSI